MPTPKGLPKSGEHWQLTVKLPPDYEPYEIDVEVLERGTGDYFSLRVRHISTGKVLLWVDAAAWLTGVTGSHHLKFVSSSVKK